MKILSNASMQNATSTTRFQTYDIDKADTAWVLTASGLVFLMIPGVGFFYSGLSRDKNKLSVLMFTLVSTGVTSLEWFLWNYSLSFSTTGSTFIGNFKHIALIGVNDEPNLLAPTIPHEGFVLYQCMFSCVTSALVFGSGIERSTLRSYIVFIFFWTILVYDFIAYWSWGINGWLRNLGTLDFAGGTPVHIASGFSSLSYAIIVGPRKGFNEQEFNTVNPEELYLGTVLLWLGWLGFNAGSGLEINRRAVNAALVSTLSGAIGGLTWLCVDMVHRKSRKMNVTAFCNGAIAGLVCITPASGFVSPASSLVFGFLGGLICVFTCKLKHFLGYDDATDVFGIHGVSGVLGGLLTGIFADRKIADGTIQGGWINQNYFQIVWQFVGVAVGAAWAFVMTSLILLALKYMPFLDLKAADDDEDRGLDLSEIGEKSFASYVVHRVTLANSASNSETKINAVHRMALATTMSMF